VDTAKTTKATTESSIISTRDEAIKTMNDAKSSMVDTAKTTKATTESSIISTRDEVLTQLKKTQKEVEDSVNKKLEADKENSEKIKQIMKTMNELIKA
jgi:serine/threonine protein kinase HipA of HipAB toxin-antitoxin module